MDGLYEFGINLIEGLQGLPEWLDVPMELITFTGTIDFYLLLIPFIYWAIHPRLGIRVLLILIGTDFVGSYAKHLFHEPRPYWLSETVLGKSTETSYGIPSTHASGTFAVWGALAIRVRENWLRILAVAMILLVAFSRLYLGVHFPHDILLGWIIGLAGLWVIVRFEDDILGWFRGYSIRNQVLISLIVSLALAFIGWLIVIMISGSPDPESWASFATEARDISHYFTVGGGLFGGLAGYILVKEMIEFNHRVPWVWRIVRYLIGIVITLAIWQGLDILFGLFATDGTFLSYLLRFIRYSAVTLWVTLGAPVVFQNWLKPAASNTTK